MDFTRPQGYVDALKELEGFPLMGMEIKDGRLVFHSLSSRVALPMDRRKGYGYGVVDYGLLAKGVVFTAEADGLTGVFVNWLAMDSPVEHVLDRGDAIYIDD